MLLKYSEITALLDNHIWATKIWMRIQFSCISFLSSEFLYLKLIIVNMVVEYWYILLGDQKVMGLCFDVKKGGFF